MRKRILDVARLHTVAWPLLIAWPIAILAISFLIGFTIFFLVGDTGHDTNFTGSVFALYGFALGFYMQAMTQTFPFALGLSVTRRDYFVATSLVAAVQSVVFGIGLFVLGRIENATDGWGVQMRMFDIPQYFTDNLWLQLLTIVASLLLLCAVGVLLGAIQQRWRVVGFFTAAVILLIALGIVAITLTWQGWWVDVGHWFVDVPRIVPLAVLPLVAGALSLTGAWAVARRATV